MGLLLSFLCFPVSQDWIYRIYHVRVTFDLQSIGPRIRFLRINTLTTISPSSIPNKTIKLFTEERTESSVDLRIGPLRAARWLWLPPQQSRTAGGAGGSRLRAVCLAIWKRSRIPGLMVRWRKVLFLLLGSGVICVSPFAKRTCTFSQRLFWHFSHAISCPRHLQEPDERF